MTETDPGEPRNSAIFYIPEGFEADRPQVKGRHSAGQGFLDGFFRHADVAAFYCYTPNRAALERFAARARANAPTARPVHWLPTGNPFLLGRAGCITISDPAVVTMAWQRRFADERSYSIVGVTHTVASHAAMQMIGDLVTGPTQPWDALVCTSRSVRSVVERILDDWQDYLAARSGGEPRCPVQLPVIPLGVHCADYAARPGDADLRRRFRSRIGAADDDVVVLFFGRLAFHAKAHPTALLLAVEEAQRATSKRLHLAFVGQFPNQPIGAAFHAAAAAYATTAQVHFLDGADREISAEAWRGADVFASLSDNIQESFGLTPVEAMAAGLPQVSSDYDGYRDTIVDGETGFLVTTETPRPGTGETYALRYLTGADPYDHYIGNACMATAVDVAACRDAVVRLANDSGLRRGMGEAARRRARQHYDWSVVIAAYQDLYAELAARRRSGTQIAGRDMRRPAHPLAADPFYSFAGHPTRALDPAMPLACRVADPLEELARAAAVVLNRHGQGMLLPQPELSRLLERIATGGVTADALLAELAPARRAQGELSLLWLRKVGILAF